MNPYSRVEQLNRDSLRPGLDSATELPEDRWSDRPDYVYVM